jgi:hypothetical protein
MTKKAKPEQNEEQIDRTYTLDTNAPFEQKWDLPLSRLEDGTYDVNYQALVREGARFIEDYRHTFFEDARLDENWSKLNAKSQYMYAYLVDYLGLDRRAWNRGVTEALVSWKKAVERAQVQQQLEAERDEAKRKRAEEKDAERAKQLELEEKKAEQRLEAQKKLNDEAIRAEKALTAERIEREKARYAAKIEGEKQLEESRKAASDEAELQRQQNTLKLDEMREKARDERKRAQQAVQQQEAAQQELLDASSYKELLIEAFEADVETALPAMKDIEIQGQAIDVPPGLLAIMGESVGGKSFAFQSRIDARSWLKKGDFVPLVTISEPGQAQKSVPAPVNSARYGALVEFLKTLLSEYGVVVVNSLTFLTSRNPHPVSDATTGPGERGLYPTFRDEIVDLDNAIAETGGLLIGVFNTTEKPNAVPIIKGAASAYALLGSNYSLEFSRRRFSIRKNTFVGTVIAETDRTPKVFEKLAIEGDSSADAKSVATGLDSDPLLVFDYDL